jgi:hypothetical protein
VITDSPTNFADALYQGIFRDSRIVPYILKKLVLCDQSTGPLSKDAQDSKRARAQTDVLSSCVTQLVGSKIY